MKTPSRKPVRAKPTKTGVASKADVATRVRVKRFEMSSDDFNKLSHRR